MSKSAVVEASDILWDLWQSGRTAADLPAHLKPATRRDGYGIQQGLDARASKPRWGWKIAATSAAGQKHINVDGPIAGRIPIERVVADGAALPLGGNFMRVCEPEFAFRFGRDLPPRAEPYSQAEVLAAVESLHLAIELPSSRFTDFTAVGGPSLIADDACAHHVVAGPAVTADWRAIDLSKHAVVAKLARGFERAGSGANVLGDPRVALTWLVEELRALGITIRRGESAITGTCMVPVDVQPGDVFSADYGVLGTIGCRLSE
jgi:2-keto-4-pentenoate hydratase